MCTVALQDSNWFPYTPSQLGTQKLTDNSVFKQLTKQKLALLAGQAKLISSIIESLGWWLEMGNLLFFPNFCLNKGLNFWKLQAIASVKCANVITFNSLTATGEMGFYKMLNR